MSRFERPVAIPVQRNRGMTVCWHLLALLALALLPMLSEAQTPKQWMKLGDQSVEDGDYYGAAHYYKKALDGDSTELGVYFKYAESLRAFNEYEKAADVYAYISDNDNPGSTVGKEYPQARFWEAMMLKYQGKYDEAIDQFELYFKTAPIKSDYFGKKAKHEMESCEFAKQLMGHGRRGGG